MVIPTISVIIPVLNEERKIEQCLEAVLSQSVKPDEVILIDGHSRDATVERARKFPVTVLFEDSHSIARGRQIGIEKAKGTYVAFTDADCVPDKNWLANLIKEFSNGIVAVGGGIKNQSQDFWEDSIHLAVSTFVGGAQTVQGRFFNDKRLVKSVSACNSLYLRQAILDIGGFNVSLPGGEEMELNYRLSRTGKLLYTPDAIVTHHHSWTLKAFAGKMFRYGKERGMVRAWNIQFLPAIAAPILLLTLIATPLIFAAALSAYVLLLISMGAKYSIVKKEPRYLGSIPLVLIIEHFMYSLGIWRGLFMKKKVQS